MSRPGAGSGPGGSGTTTRQRPSTTADQRVRVEWTTLRLSEATGEGYAESARPLEDLLPKAAMEHGKGLKPVVIFICDEEDEDTARELDCKVFCDEKVGLALKRFVCLKGVIQTIPDQELADQLARQTPLFYFYDPAGNEFDVLKGKRATSRSGFSSRVEKLWDISYEFRLKEYVKGMSRILDRMDDVAMDLSRVRDKMERAADNPPKLAKLQREEEQLKGVEAKTLEDEAELVEKIVLRPEFRGEGEAVQK